MRVLVDPRRGTFHDIVPAGSEFRVAAPLKWVDAPEEVDRSWSYTPGVGFAPPPVVGSEESVDEMRAKAMRVLLDELLDARGAEPGAPKSIRDYVAAKAGGR